MGIGSTREIKVLAGVPEKRKPDLQQGHARHTSGENLLAAVAYKQGKLTAEAAFACCDGRVAQRDIDTALGWHPTRFYTE